MSFTATTVTSDINTLFIKGLRVEAGPLCAVDPFSNPFPAHHSLHSKNTFSPVMTIAQVEKSAYIIPGTGTRTNHLQT